MAKITYGLLLLIVSTAYGGLTPPDSPGDIDAFNARSDGRSGKKELNDIDCHEMNTSCVGCINLEHCYFQYPYEGETKCVDNTKKADMTINKLIVEVVDDCLNESSDATKIPPKFNPNVTTDETTVPTGSSTESTSTTTVTTDSTTQSTTTTKASTTSSETTTSQRYKFYKRVFF